jgi:hypothetical protein
MLVMMPFSAKAKQTLMSTATTAAALMLLLTPMRRRLLNSTLGQL